MTDLLPLYDAERHVYRVPSRTREGVSYELSARGVGGLVVVSCGCQASARQLPAGLMACWHRRAVCHDLERQGLVVLVDDRWRITERAVALDPDRLRTRFVEPGPFCPGCGEKVDDDVLIPVARQQRHLNGVPWHAECLPVGSPSGLR